MEVSGESVQSSLLENAKSVELTQMVWVPVDVIQPRNYQVSKKVVHEIKFGDIAVIQIQTICGIVTVIIILIDSLRCLKEAKAMDMILGVSVNFNIVSLFSITYVVWFTLKFPIPMCTYNIETIPMCTYNICLSNNFSVSH